MSAEAWPPSAAVPPLTRDDVHVWQSRLDQEGPALQLFESLLDDEERRRAARWHFRIDRQRYTVGRGLLKLLLAKYLTCEPDAIRLWYNSYGKPGLTGEDGPGGLKFNLAHSDGLVLYVVTRGREVGVDVERIRPGVDWRELASRFFAPGEVAELSAVAPDLREQAFFAGWTRKEAYLKALGLGMAVPLDGFAVTLAPGRPAALVAAEHDPSQLGRWEFRELAPASGYVGALAVEGAGCRFFCGRWEPLG
jgi:4'-phosphopantetheinyl transferase